MSEEKKATQLVLKNVSVKYAKVIRADKAYDDSQPDLWSVNMYVSEEDREILMAHGVNPSEDKKGGPDYFVAKRNVTSRGKAPVKPPVIVKANKMPWDGEDIGNGSVCNIAVTLFPWQKSKTQRGVLIYLNAIQVVTHVPYNTGGVDQFEAIGDTRGDEVTF
jgi:hypothetical protein